MDQFTLNGHWSPLNNDLWSEGQTLCYFFFDARDFFTVVEKHVLLQHFFIEHLSIFVKKMHYTVTS